MAAGVGNVFVNAPEEIEKRRMAGVLSRSRHDLQAEAGVCDRRGSTLSSRDILGVCQQEQGRSIHLQFEYLVGAESTPTPTPRICGLSLAAFTSIASSSLTSTITAFPTTHTSQWRIQGRRGVSLHMLPPVYINTDSSLQSWTTPSTSQTPLAINHTPTRSNSKRTSTTRSHGAPTPTTSSMSKSPLSL